jgi:hypothetical protein
MSKRGYQCPDDTREGIAALHMPVVEVADPQVMDFLVLRLFGSLAMTSYNVLLPLNKRGPGASRQDRCIFNGPTPSLYPE